MVKQTVAEKQSSMNSDDNKRGSEERNDSRFKGVRKRKWGKYVSEIRLPNSRERIWLGSYDTAEKAARAFDAALFCLRGRSASFNFPDNPPDIAGGRSLAPAEIQAAAARFANASPDPNNDSGCSGRVRPEESQSPSVSEGSVTVQLDSELTNDGSFMDFFGDLGSGQYDSGYGLFPGFDELNLTGDFFAPPFPSVNDYGAEDNSYVEGVLPQESFLWNF